MTWRYIMEIYRSQSFFRFTSFLFGFFQDIFLPGLGDTDDDQMTSLIVMMACTLFETNRKKKVIAVYGVQP